MSDWSDLVRASLLGTERSPVPPGHLVAPPGLPPEEVLLAQAALAAQYARVGALPAQVTAPALPASPHDERPPLPESVTPLLAELLDLEKDTLLRQAIDDLARGERRLPGGALPLLLDAGAARPALRQSLAELVGPRGRWLAAQRETWRYAAVDPADPTALQKALTPFSGDEVAFLHLAQLLRCAPAAGIAQATRVLGDRSQTARARTRLLPVLEAALTPEMEPLLERALDNRLFSLRRQAATQLSRLPGSAYGRRMLARLLQILDWQPPQKGAPAQISLRQEVTPDAGMQRDYLRRRPRADRALQAWEVRLLFQAAPLDALAAALEAAPEEILVAAARADRGRIIIRGLITAVSRQNNLAWAEALLEAPELTRGTQAIAAGLLEVLPPQARESLVRRSLTTGRSPGATPRLHPLAALLRRCTHAWSPAFTRQVFEWLRDFLGGSRRGGSDVIFRNTMRDVAPYVDLDVAAGLLPELLRAPLPRSWQPALEQLARDLRLRRRIVNLLNPEEEPQ